MSNFQFPILDINLDPDEEQLLVKQNQKTLSSLV